MYAMFFTISAQSTVSRRDEARDAASARVAPFLLRCECSQIHELGGVAIYETLADLCPCFHRAPTKLCPDLVSFMCWIATEFLSFAL